MMKRLIAFVLTVIIVFSFVGCDPTENTENEANALKEIESIVFNSNGAGIPEAEEVFYEDATHYYLFDCMISEYVTVTYADGSTETVKDALTNGHIKITDLDKYRIGYKTDPKLVEKIVDLTESGEIGCDDALEEFYRDENYIYRFSCIKSEYVIVYYKDGTEQNVKNALNEGKIRIADLDWFGIGYSKVATEEMRAYIQQLASCFAHRGLTLLDLKMLVAHYGEDLSWEHFSSYHGRDVGSGIKILEYSINEEYCLWVGGAGVGEPHYIYLFSKKDIENRIDVRYESIVDFLNANQSPVVVPEDFSFSLTWGVFGISSYDSKTGKLIKTTDATVPEDYVTHREFAAWQRTYIYELLSKLDIKSYPDVYDPGNGLSDPSATLILTVRVNGTEKTVKAEDVSLSLISDNEKGQAFLDTCKEISDLLTATTEWRRLPEYENLYE